MTASFWNSWQLWEKLCFVSEAIKKYSATATDYGTYHQVLGCAIVRIRGHFSLQT